MSLVLRRLVYACTDPYELSQFWGRVFRRPVDAGPNGCWVELGDGNQPETLFFQRVFRDKSATNQLHLDLNPAEGTLAEEIIRLTELGARFISEHERAPGLRWVVFADPEGNEFCVESSDGEVAAFREEIRASIERENVVDSSGGGSRDF